MPQRDPLVGAPCWIDLMSSDLSRTIPFYSGLFGWTCRTDEDPREGGYAVFSKDGQPVAGIAPRVPENPYSDMWTVYLESADAAATTQQAVDAGGQVIMPPMQVGDQGSMSVLSDPAGAVFGVWQPHLHPGFGRWGEPGTPAWFETLSRDYRAAVPFYESVFGWTITPIADTDEFRYAQATLDGGEIAGVMDAAAILSAETPSIWRWYVAVEDADATVSKVFELGGSVGGPAQDSPYGRVATVADPFGAQLVIVATPSG